MKHVIWAVVVIAAFVGGWKLSRNAVLKAYPPEVVRFITDTNELVEPMSKAEQKKLLENMKNTMVSFSKQYDYQAFYEGTAALYFQSALDNEGPDEARNLTVKLLTKFRGEYEKGLDLPDGELQIAKALYDRTTKNKEGEQDGGGQPATRSESE